MDCIAERRPKMTSSCERLPQIKKQGEAHAAVKNTSTGESATVPADSPVEASLQIYFLLYSITGYS